MTITYSQFFGPTVLTTSATTLLTIPATPSTIILRGARIRLTNTTAGPVTATLYAVPAAGTAADGNAFLKGKTVPANDYLDIDVTLMVAGGLLQGLAGAATSITAHMISGSYYTP